MRKNVSRPIRTALWVMATAALFANSRSAIGQVGASADLGTAMSRAAELREPLVVVVADVEGSRTDDKVRAIFESPLVKAESERTQMLLLDVAVSRNRATATRFHLVETPMLVCLSSRGIIVSRDEGPITKSLVLKRIEEATQEGPRLDARLLSLSETAAKGDDATAQFQLADFLVAHHNALEAIRPLAAIAHSKAITPEARVRAWVALVRAHYWIAEPEKGRHEAEDLIATLGPETPEAVAGGKLVLGIQDAGGKRTALARREFEAAIAAAPGSSYAKEASEAMANLPKGGRG